MEELSVEDDFAAAEAILAASDGKSKTKVPKEKTKTFKIHEKVSFERQQAVIQKNELSKVFSEDALNSGVIKLQGFIDSFSGSYAYVNVIYNRKDVAAMIQYKVRTKYLTYIDNPADAAELVKRASESMKLFLRKKQVEEEESKRMEKEQGLSTTGKRKKLVKEIAEEIHPGLWDFAEIKEGEYTLDISGRSRPKFRLVIKFPEIKITNSNGRERDLKDLYVQMMFNKDMEHTGTLYGIRGKLFYDEMCSDYGHSHLPGTVGWRRFCLGGGSTTASQLTAGLCADRWNPDRFRQLLVLLYGYTAWESLEGGPHRRMERIHNGSGQSSRSVNGNTKDRLYKSFIANHDDFPCVMENRGMFIMFKINAADEEFERLVTALCPGEFKVIKAANGTYQMSGSLGAGQVDVSRVHQWNAERQAAPLRQKIVFQGEVLATQCITTEEPDAEKEEILVANPDITRHIARKLEKEINEYKLKKESYELEG